MTNGMYFMIFKLAIQIPIAYLTAHGIRRTLQMFCRDLIPGGLVGCFVKNNKLLFGLKS